MRIKAVNAFLIWQYNYYSNTMTPAPSLAFFDRPTELEDLAPSNQARHYYIDTAVQYFVHTF